MNTAILLAIYGVISFVVGYYVGHRGLSGVLNDIEDIKADISNLKDKTANVPASAPVA